MQIKLAHNRYSECSYLPGQSSTRWRYSSDPAKEVTISEGFPWKPVTAGFLLDLR